MPLPVLQPSRVTVMIKPVGALCNLDCHYCYYLPTKTIYDGREHRMKLKVLEEVFASLLPNFADDVTIAWQGGEPTLAGLDFFRKAIEFQKKHKKPGQRIHHALQTNGTLLDDAWCQFLREEEFLVGLSVDGPRHFHDRYRLTNRQTGSHDQVLRGLRLLQQHAVDYNILCVLNDFNVNHPDEVMNYLLNLGSRWLQFIPAVEWEPDPAHPGKNVMAPYSPDPAGYGRFLCRVFDLWFEKYRKRVSIRIIDAVLNKLVLNVMPFCILDGACHGQMTIEHDGAVFGCDHFVERRWQLAKIGEPGWINSIRLDGAESVGLTIHSGGFVKLDAHDGRDIDRPEDMAGYVADDAATAVIDAAAPDAPDALDTGWLDRVDGARLGAFAARKQHLPEKCKACQWKPYCHGGCPKHRPSGGEVPEPTILCAGYMAFYEHAMPRLKWLAGFLRQNMLPPDPPAGPPAPGSAPAPAGGSAATVVPPSARPVPAKVGRNEPCPCGSGLKFKNCHGKVLRRTLSRP